MICNKCGSKLKNDSKFCRKCGNKTSIGQNNAPTPTPTATVKPAPTPTPTIKICNRCGSRISGDTVFCSKCGNNIGSVNYDEINNNAESSNAQTDDVSKVENTNPNIEQQYKRYKKRNRHRFIRMCGIVLILLIAETGGSNYIGIVVIMILVELARSYYIATLSKNPNPSPSVNPNAKANTNINPNTKANTNTNTNTENTPKKQNPDDYGLSEEKALKVAQEFIDTHPLFKRTITGSVQYEPETQIFSTKGLFQVEIKTDDGLRGAIWVDKRTGAIFLTTDGTTLEDGEEVYEKKFVNNQDNDEILFDGIKLSEYLDSSTKFIYDKFGPDKYGTDVGGTRYANYKYLGYDGVSFLYKDSSSIQSICGKPELFTYNDVTLNKNCDELVELFGTPLVEDSVYDNTTGKSTYWINYNKGNYTIKFEFSSENSDAYLIKIYK